MTTKSTLIRERFGDIWPHHNMAFNTLLIQCRKFFDGDLEAMLVLSIIGERTFHAQRGAGLRYSEFSGGFNSPSPPKRMNVQSVAEFSGIPRETVRRKTEKLIDRGWLARGPGNFLVVTPKAAEDLKPLTELTMEYLAMIASRLGYPEDSPPPD